MTTNQRKRVLTYILLAVLAAVPPVAAYMILGGGGKEKHTFSHMAGRNQRQLQRVLNHYSRDAADSLEEDYAVIDVVNIVKRHLEERIAYSEELQRRRQMMRVSVVVLTESCSGLSLWY